MGRKKSEWCLTPADPSHPGWLAADLKRKEIHHNGRYGICLTMRVSLLNWIGNERVVLLYAQKTRWDLSRAEVLQFIAEQWRPCAEIGWTWKHSSGHGRRARLELPLSWHQVMEYSAVLNYDLSQVKGVAS